MQPRLSSESGQDTVEWGGLLPLVALVLGALLVHSTPLAIEGTILAGGKQTSACSGSITRDIYDGPNDPVDANTSLVTMTIGGNDARGTETPETPVMPRTSGT